MFAKIIIIIIFGILLIIGCNQIDQDIVNSTYPEEQEVIKNLVQEIFDTVSRKDADKLDAFHLYGSKFTRLSEGSPVRFDAESTKKMESESVAALDKFNFKIEDTKADIFGKIAIATFFIDYSFKMGEIEGKAKESCTIVFVKDNETWKITHEHFSPVAED